MERIIDVLNAIHSENSHIEKYHATEMQILLHVWKYIHDTDMEKLEDFSITLESLYNAGENSTMANSQMRADALMSLL